MLLQHRPEVQKQDRLWLEEKVESFQMQNYSVAQRTGLVDGVTGIAVPIKWMHGLTLGSLSVVAIDERLEEIRRAEVAEILSCAAASVVAKFNQ